MANHPSGVPTVGEFKRALLALRRLRQAHMDMLEAHYRAPGHQLTASQLAESAKYSRYSDANLHYGRLGKAIANELKCDSPMQGDNGPVWTGVLASGNDDDPDAPEYIWTMHPELVTALSELNWGFTKPKKAPP